MLANVEVIREDAPMDFAAAGLLGDLDGQERAQREQLLERLLDDGFSPEELARAVKANRLALLPVDRVLGGAYTATEIEQRTGLPEGTMVRIRRQHGLPDAAADDRVFSDEDVEAAESMKLFLDAGFDGKRIDEITRVLGEGMARLSATITAAFVETFLKPGASEEDVALRFAALAERLTPACGPILIDGFKAALRDSVQRGMLGLAELEAGDIAGAQEVAVCSAPKRSARPPGAASHGPRPVATSSRACRGPRRCTARGTAAGARTRAS